MSAAPIVIPEIGVLDDARDLVRRGRVRSALGLVTASLREPRHEARQDRTALLAVQVDCHLAHGDLGAALARGDELAGAGDRAAAHHARAELASALGEADLAVERFLAVADAPDADPLALPWRVGAALAMLRLGHRAEALDLARTQHALALRCGAAYDLALAVRVLATTDPDIQRAPRLEDALALLDGVEAERLRAQINADLAGLLLLEGRPEAALVHLRAAESYAAREDLWPLQSRVRRLLDRMGAAPRRLESEALAVLTAAERRVALLALEGMTNRQIAERLLVSVKAVEGHLSKVYRKLGVGSRGALVASFAMLG